MKEGFKKNISVLIVTYGNRWHFLKKVLAKIKENEKISSIILVNNGCTYDLSASLEKEEFNVELIDLKENTGSSNAFHEGFKYFLENRNEALIWCLDDDNLPNNNSLEFLLENINKQTACVSLRDDRKKYELIAKGFDYKKTFEGNNAFNSFEVKRFFRKFKRIDSADKSLSITPIKIPHCYYGGLLLPREILNKIELPKRALFLYADDHIFTHGITKNNFNLLLIPKSQITDLEQSWFTKKPKGILNNPLLWSDDIRAFYATRNGIYFSKFYLCDNKAVFYLNGLIFISLFTLSCIRYSKPKRLKLILKAIYNGIRGDLD